MNMTKHGGLYASDSTAFAQAIARDVGASSRAIQVAQPDTSSRDAELQAIRASGEIPWYDIEALEEPDTSASEHLVWFKDGFVLKATAGGRFGHSIDKGPGNATPLEYLRRIAATNEALNDTAKIVGKFEDRSGRLGLLHLQTFVVANPRREKATFPQIVDFLTSRGFVEAQGHSSPYTVWVSYALRIEISDCHPGNFILSADEMVVPIDVLASRFDMAEATKLAA